MTISYLDLAAVFPQFKTSDPGRITQINAFIRQATSTLSADFFGENYNLACLYKVADLVSRSDHARAGGGMAAGKVASRSVEGEYSVSYAFPRSSSVAALASSNKSDFGSLLEELISDVGAINTTLNCGCGSYAPQSYVPICFTQNIDQDLVVKQGATFERIITLSQSCTPIDLTGYSASAQIRESYGSTSVLATFTVEFLDRPNGQIKLILTDDVTRLLPPNLIRADRVSFDISDLSAPPYVWDIELTDPGDRVIRPLNGQVLVSPEVTR